MIHPETHLVTEANGPRPAGHLGECFYCKAKLGEQHEKDCVIRTRTVVLRMTTELVVEIPENWEEDMIHFHRNEGSWCASNVIEELKEGGCICQQTSFEFLREATQEDDERWNKETLKP